MMMTKRSKEKAALLASDIKVYECGQMPPAGELEEAPRLERWSTAVRRRGQEFVLVVKGDLHRHPEFPDGGDIQTSAVQWFDRKALFCRTINRLYALGQPAGDEEGIDT